MAMSGLRTCPVRSPRHALGSIVGVVSELGEVLELLHDAAGRVTTLSATLREWWDEQQSRRAMEAAVHNAQGASHTWLVGDGEPSPPPRYREHRTSIHYQRPGRYRSERQPVAASQEPAVLHVCDGTREWTYVPDRAEAWVQQAGAYQMADDLLDPAWLPGGVPARGCRAPPPRGTRSHPAARAPAGRPGPRLRQPRTPRRRGDPGHHRRRHRPAVGADQPVRGRAIVAPQPARPGPQQATGRSAVPLHPAARYTGRRRPSPPAPPAAQPPLAAALLATPATPCRHLRPLPATALADRLKIADYRRPLRHAKD
jgi:hypothetical protein